MDKVTLTAAGSQEVLVIQSECRGGLCFQSVCMGTSFGGVLFAFWNPFGRMKCSQAFVNIAMTIHIVW